MDFQGAFNRIIDHNIFINKLGSDTLVKLIQFYLHDTIVR